MLLVDDESDIVSILKTGLELHGYSVDGYESPTRALAEYRPGHYDFHILDIRMPGINCFDLARQIWAQDPKAQVCFLSAFEIYEDEARKVFKDLNTKCFIKKPVTALQLAEHLQIHSSLAK